MSQNNDNKADSASLKVSQSLAKNLENLARSVDKFSRSVDSGKINPRRMTTDGR